MLLENKGECIAFEGVTFFVGDRVHSKEDEDYGGLDGTIIEIHTDEDIETDNDGPDIYCAFDIPDDPQKVAELEARFSELYHEPKTIDEIGLDCVIMEPDMLEILEPDQSQDVSTSFSPRL